MARTTQEWIGKTDDSPIPPRVRLRIWFKFGGVCQGRCCRKLDAGDKWHADHKVALINGGENRESNLQLLCDWCHGKKTKRDVAEKSVTARKQKSNLGIRKPRSIRGWKKFNGTPVFAPRER